MDYTIVHFEIPAHECRKAKSFMKRFWLENNSVPIREDYWVIQTVPIDSNGLTLRPRVNGGMFRKQQPGINYFAVKSINDYLAKIQKLGGKVILPKQEVPNVGWIVAAEDPEGNKFALVQPLRV